MGKETADRIDALMDEYPAGWMRDPLGHRWRARMSYDVSHGVGQMFQVSIDWDAERMREAW